KECVTDPSPSNVSRDWRDRASPACARGLGIDGWRQGSRVHGADGNREAHRFGDCASPLLGTSAACGGVGLRPLRRLDPRARSRLSAAFLRPDAEHEAPIPDVTEYVTPLHREVDIEPILNLMEYARARMLPVDSDSWLAPRLHACLRLNRYEAA